MGNKAQGGCLQQQPEKRTDALNVFIGFDQTFLDKDIQGSITHAIMLAHRNIIPEEEKNAIVRGLKGIQADSHNYNTEFRHVLGDVHLNIEHELMQRIRDPGGRLHMDCSRND